MKNARNIVRRKLLLAMWPVLGLNFLIACFPKSGAKDIQSEQRNSCNENSTQVTPGYFKFLKHYCPDYEPGAPLLLAYTPSQSIEGDVFAELVAGRLASVQCAPPPALIDTEHPSRTSKPWELSTAPRLLIWYQSEPSKGDESFYLVDKGGFPILSQSLTLAEDGEFMVTLEPNLSGQQKFEYFLYLKKPRDDDSQMVWMQPIVSSTNL
jgi:hypothetical protein